MRALQRLLRRGRSATRGRPSSLRVEVRRPAWRRKSARDEWSFGQQSLTLASDVVVRHRQHRVREILLTDRCLIVEYKERPVRHWRATVSEHAV